MKATQHQTPWSAQVFGAWDRYKVGLLTLAFRYEDAYKARDSVTNCPTGGSSAVVSCVTDPSGPPKKMESAIASLEFRRSRMTFLGKDVAIGPSVNYDFHASVVGVDFPIYLWTDEKGRLTGGIRAGWRDDKGGIDVGLFIGTPFTLSPGK
jgi:hypothetical protein